MTFAMTFALLLWTAVMGFALGTLWERHAVPALRAWLEGL